MPSNNKLLDYLCNLFSLGQYLSLQDREIKSPKAFRTRIWESKIICVTNNKNNMHIRREAAICEIALSNTLNSTTYFKIQSSSDHEAIAALMNDEIIGYDDIFQGYYLFHDVYEEWVLKHIIEKNYEKQLELEVFYNDLGNGLIIRKNFRLWIHDKLDEDVTKIGQFLNASLIASNIAQIWKDEILISLMNDEKSDDFLHVVESILSYDNYALLMRAVFLLNTACKVVNMAFFKLIFSREELSSHNRYRYTEPTGTGWNFIFNYIYNNFEYIQWNAINLMAVSNALATWVNRNKDGATTKIAGLLALKIYDIIENADLRYIIRDENKAVIAGVILGSALEITSELEAIFHEIIETKDTHHMSKYYNLCILLLKDNNNSYALCAANPSMVIELAKCFWIRTEKRSYMSSIDIDGYFGVSGRHDYYPASAHQTPVFQLLRSAPGKTISFIIEFIDYVTQCYYNSRLNTDYNECYPAVIYLPDGTTVNQIASERLWSIHRGTSVAPDLVESMLMALERWLLTVANEFDKKVIERFCYQLLSKSHSVAITSVVVSVVIAYPAKLFEIACILLHTKEIYTLDIARYVKEHGANFLKGLSFHNKLHDQERIASNNQEFRQKRFEDIILEYQINPHDLSSEDLIKRNDALYSQIDAAYARLESDDKSARFAFHRFDIRKMEPDFDSSIEVDDKTYIPLVSSLPDDLRAVTEKTRQEHDQVEKHLPLTNWARSRFDKDAGQYSKIKHYEENPQNALNELYDIFSNGWESLNFLSKDTPFYVSAVLIRDFPQIMSEEQFFECSCLLLGYLRQYVKGQKGYQAGDGTDAAIAVLPHIIAKYPSLKGGTLNNPCVIFLSLLLSSGQDNLMAINSFCLNAWERCPLAAQKIFRAYVLVKSKYDLEVNRYNGIHPLIFLKKERGSINQLMASDQNLAELDFAGLSKNQLLTTCMLLAPNNNMGYEVLLKIGPPALTFIFSKEDYRDDRRGRDYHLQNAFTQWLGFYIYFETDKTTRNTMLEMLGAHITESDDVEHTLSHIIHLQDTNKNTEVFWHIWDKLYSPITQLCNKRKESYIRSSRDHHYSGRGLESIITTYALAYPWWKESAKTWHTLSMDKLSLFYRLSADIGYNPIVLYSVARFLNSIGYEYIIEGLDWLFEIISRNSHLSSTNLPTNTDYYLEEFAFRYLSSHENEIKKKGGIYKKIMCLLDFLVARGSTVGFMLRENIV